MNNSMLLRCVNQEMYIKSCVLKPYRVLHEILEDKTNDVNYEQQSKAVLRIVVCHLSYSSSFFLVCLPNVWYYMYYLGVVMCTEIFVLLQFCQYSRISINSFIIFAMMQRNYFTYCNVFWKNSSVSIAKVWESSVAFIHNICGHAVVQS